MKDIKDELEELPDTHQILIQVTARDLSRVIHAAINKAIRAGENKAKNRRGKLVNDNTI